MIGPDNGTSNDVTNRHDGSANSEFLLTIALVCGRTCKYFFASFVYRSIASPDTPLDTNSLCMAYDLRLIT